MNPSRRDRGCLRHGVPLAVALLLTACSGSNPASPTPPATGSPVPTLSSPPDDSVAAAHPSLVVNNAVTAQAGPRTYDFQVADSLAALTGPDTGLFASATGIAEGANGHTSYDLTRDLQSGARYYWHARVTQAGVAGPWSSGFRFRTALGTNTPPVIQSISANARTEPNSDVNVTAVVTDQETSPANLTYEWTSIGGSFTGTGPSVRWRVQSVSGPTAFDLTLTVIERYTVALDGGGEETRENRVSGKTTVHVNDSSPELSGLAFTFLDDFIHSERSPEFCVRNFSDNCQGKQDELSDIRKDRAMFTNDPARSSLGSSASIGFFDTGSVGRQAVPPSQASFAQLMTSCNFAATNLSTHQFGVAIGTCLLTGVYENWQWRLCTSNFLPQASGTAVPMSRRF